MVLFVYPDGKDQFPTFGSMLKHAVPVNATPGGNVIQGTWVRAGDDQGVTVFECCYFILCSYDGQWTEQLPGVEFDFRHASPQIFLMRAGVGQ